MVSRRKYRRSAYRKTSRFGRAKRRIILRVVMAILRKHYVTGLYTVEDIAGLDIADCLVVSPEGKRISVTSTHVRPSALPFIQEQAKEHFRARF